MLGGCSEASPCPWLTPCLPAVLLFAEEGGQAPPAPFIHQALWHLHASLYALRIPLGWGHCRAVGRDCVGSSWILLIPTTFT